MRSPGLKSRVMFQGRGRGSEAQGGGAAVRTARGCGRAVGSRGSRDGGRGRMPRGAPTRLRGRAPRAVKAQKPGGRGRTGSDGGGEARGGVGVGGGRVRGRAASRSLPVSARPPQPKSYPTRLREVHRSTTEKTPPPEAEMLLSPLFPFLPPHRSSVFFSPEAEAPRGWEVGERRRGEKKDGKRQGNVALPSTHGLSHSLLPDGRSPGPNLDSPAGRGHFPARARSEATEGGRGESPPPAHLPGPRALRLRWRAGRLRPRPRKPPAPPAAAEPSQRLRITTAAASAAAAAALLPRGSRSAPASTGAVPIARRRRGR